ncbi:unnamed protein product [Phaeothamnion confervicola]
MTAAKMLWHKAPLGKFLAYEVSNPGFRPFLIGLGAKSCSLFPNFVSWHLDLSFSPLASITTSRISAFVCGVIPARGITDEVRSKSPYWRQSKGKEGEAHH